MQFFYDDIMASFAITFSGDIGIVLFRLTLGLNSLERNDIVLFLLTLGLTAQKHLARGRASASPRVNVPNDFRLVGARRYFAIYLRNAIFLNYRIKFARLR